MSCSPADAINNPILLKFAVSVSCLEELRNAESRSDQQPSLCLAHATAQRPDGPARKSRQT